MIRQEENRMEKGYIFAHVDHTQLKATATWQDIQVLCEEAIQYKTASVCIPPSYVSRVKETYGGQVNIGTVVGFPLGYQTTAVKVLEAQVAISEGANEIDMVVNLGDVKNGEYEKVFLEVLALRQETEGHILKVIIEACYLTEPEKVALCKIVTRAGADFIKTSTGFGSGGATLEDVQLFKEHIGPLVKIKAAGGIKTQEDLELFLENDCERIGTSSAVKILAGGTAETY
jgi:deoxyribose-phosphate aldolase